MNALFFWYFGILGGFLGLYQKGPGRPRKGSNQPRSECKKIDVGDLLISGAFGKYDPLQKIVLKASQGVSFDQEVVSKLASWFSWLL